jgi:S-DNA-T family DNA segregation ATPase FtsK/SpoIIIE
MSQGFAALRKPLRLALGLDAGGSAFAVNLRAMPHVLIGGTAGSGKSTCIHAFIASLLLHNDPDTVRFLLIDTKMVELGLYNDIPHLTAPVIMDPEQAASALETVRAESRKRLEQFRALAVRDISAYNRPGASAGAPRLPFLVIVVDDVAELLAASPGVAAQALASLAADGRPAGIHLIASTSRPSDSLVARSIKGNFPARIAFRVTSAAESRIILDRDGAEKLLRDGDMLFLRPDSTEPVRIQGAYVSDGEIHRIADYWRKAAEERQRQEPDNSQTNE